MILQEDVHALVRELVYLVDTDQESEANLRISNFYHRKKRTEEEYHTLLRFIKRDEGYEKASKHAQEKIALFLYLLDKRHSKIQSVIFVERRSGTYRITERSTRR